MKKRITSLILALSVCVSMATPTLATGDAEAKILLDVADGKFVAEEMVEAQNTLDSFFSTRAYNANGVATFSSATALDSVSPKFSEDAVLRTEALKDFWYNEDVEIISTSVSNHVLAAKESARDGSIDAVVYEWTWVDYVDSDSPVTDRMGFATVHDMTLMPTNDGTYCIVRDSYDETDISGHTSIDYDAEKYAEALKGISTANMYDKVLNEAGIDASPAAVAVSTNMPNVFGCIKYADTWVGKDISSDLSNHTYNPAYGAFPSDCCNYVSQCLRAGGVEMDPTESPTGWWWRKGANPNNSGDAWRSVSAFDTYWRNQGLTRLSATTSNTLPGNPVYYFSTTNHIAICVGYNSAGNPIINGHTRDVYHQKLSSIYTYTLKFNKSNPFVVNPQSATAVSLGTTSGLYLQAGKGEWFKFTPTSSGYYTVYATGNTDTYGGLYQNTHSSSYGDTIYLYELYSDDDGHWDGLNFRVGYSLTANQTYYILVCGGGSDEASASGVFNLVVQKG